MVAVVTMPYRLQERHLQDAPKLWGDGAREMLAISIDSVIVKLEIGEQP